MQSQVAVNEAGNNNVIATKVKKFKIIFNTSMEKRVSAELLGTEQSNSKNASSDSLNSDSKSSSLNSKMGQESVRNRAYLIKIDVAQTLILLLIEYRVNL